MKHLAKQLAPCSLCPSEAERWCSPDCAFVLGRHIASSRVECGRWGCSNKGGAACREEGKLNLEQDPGREQWWDVWEKGSACRQGPWPPGTRQVGHFRKLVTGDRETYWGYWAPAGRVLSSHNHWPHGARAATRCQSPNACLEHRVTNVIITTGCHFCSTSQMAVHVQARRLIQHVTCEGAGDLKGSWRFIQM